MIRGYFDPAEPDHQLARLKIRVGIARVPNSPEIIWSEIPFVIDTGSETTCLHPRDAIFLLGIDPGVLKTPSGWPVRAERIGIGGSSTYFLLPCLHEFTHDDGARHPLEGVLEIAQLTDFNLTLPSVLGWDVLQHFALRLDWSQRLVELS